MKKTIIAFISVGAVAFAMTGCGEDSKQALKETGAAIGKLGVTTVVDGAANVAETGVEVVKGTGSAVADEVGKGIDKVSAVVSEEWDSASKTVEKKVDSVKKGVK